MRGASLQKETTRASKLKPHIHFISTCYIELIYLELLKLEDLFIYTNRQTQIVLMMHALHLFMNRWTSKVQFIQIGIMLLTQLR